MAPRKPKPSKALSDVVKHRRDRGENQSTFWARLGVTQSGGSRYENGRTIPTATAMLLVLRELGKVTDADLEEEVAQIVNVTPVTVGKGGGIRVP